MYEFEMLFTFGQLQNTAQPTIIDKQECGTFGACTRDCKDTFNFRDVVTLGELRWRPEYFLSYQTIRAIKVLPLRVNFRPG
jgi:hypothetical protein